MTNRLALVACAALLWASGCVVDNPVAYDQCAGDKDCSGFGADVCQGVTVNWPGSGTATNGLCTTNCTEDLDCSRSANGELGLCARNAILGAPGGTCFERCNVAADCSAGFTCADNKTVPGLAAYESICVPTWTTTPPVNYDYEACTNANQCDVTCATVTQAWTGSTSTASICTRGCVSDAGCQPSYNGQNGYCSTSAILGLTSGTCFERCYTDDDCISGFVCGSSKDVAGLPAGNRLCVPGNAGSTAKEDAYDTCASYAADCPTGTTSVCQPLDPKWESTSAQFSLAVCTVPCTSNANCPLGPTGVAGFCAPANSLAPTAVCVARCDYDEDCAPGFLCAYANGVSGIPDTATDPICLPDPYYGN